MSVPDSACAAIEDLDVPTLYYVVRRLESHYQKTLAAAWDVKSAGEPVSVQDCFRGRALEADNVSYIVRDIIALRQKSSAPMVGSDDGSRSLPVPSPVASAEPEAGAVSDSAPARASLEGES